MKTNIPPTYREVVFRDRSADLVLRTGSTITTEKTIELDGAIYPLVDVEISSSSHPLWSGRERVIDTEGRVQRFQRRYGGQR